jgi:flagellar basal body-associated protein FliL
MDFLIKSKILYIIIGILIVLNLLSIGTLWVWKIKDGHRPPPMSQQHMQKDGKMFLMNELKLNKTQSDEIEKLRDEHFKKVSPIFEDIHKLKDELFAQMPSKDSIKAAEITNKIGVKQSELELETFRHFQKVRDILDDTQKQKFEVIIKDMVKPEGFPPFRQGHHPENPDMPPPDMPGR